MKEQIIVDNQVEQVRIGVDGVRYWLTKRKKTRLLDPVVIVLNPTEGKIVYDFFRDNPLWENTAGEACPLQLPPKEVDNGQ